MKKLNFTAMFALIAGVFLFSCSQTTEEEVQPQNEVSPEVLDQLSQLGFNVNDNGTYKIDNGYIVEGDILLTEADLAGKLNASLVPTAAEEQYHTDFLVTGLPRTIDVFVSTSFSSKYFTAVDAAISRYNAESLRLSFRRVTSSSGADISIKPSPWYYSWYGILGSAGFPTSAGNPHNEILLTRAYYDGVSDIGALTTTIAHEMGHCIGFRHTDYFDRSYSCGGSTNNEGDGGVGANHIPGTPTGASVRSWMLACSDGTDRPFNSADKTALAYVY
ncbi:M57 family metalloprotease [Roseivirga sp. BDSF3-8]|uniref:M57 family metalloprotease n=1 Tax=Roseivirga sp. BDSF3-8 TaxID=3241598 RepID=UPI003532380D